MSVIESSVEDRMNSIDETEKGESLKMNSRKTLVPLFLLDILELNTNYKKQLTQEDLLRRLDEYPYSIDIDRKALGRDIQLLMTEFPEIRKGTNGIYYDRGIA